MSGDTVQQDVSGVRFPPPLYYLIGLLIGFLIHWRLPVYLVVPQHRRIVDALGILMMLLAMMLFAWAIINLRRVGTSPNPHLPTKALTTQGPYQFTRNPIYIAFALVCAGLSLLLNMLWLLLSVPVVLVIVDRVVIRKEERYLEAKFGDEYRQYQNRVRRWI